MKTKKSHTWKSAGHDTSEEKKIRVYFCHFNLQQNSHKKCKKQSTDGTQEIVFFFNIQYI